MYTEINGNLLAKDRRFALVVSRFNDLITSRLLDGAVDCFSRHGGATENLTVVRVPGAFEIPFAAAKLAKMDAIQISPSLDYASLTGFSAEAKEKLLAVRPLTVGQAARIPGIRQGDIALLMMLTRKWNKP